MAVLMDIWMVILNELNITFIFAGFRADLGSRLRCAASMVNGERGKMVFVAFRSYRMQ